MVHQIEIRLLEFCFSDDHLAAFSVEGILGSVQVLDEQKGVIALIFNVDIVDVKSGPQIDGDAANGNLRVPLTAQVVGYSTTNPRLHRGCLQGKIAAHHERDQPHKEVLGDAYFFLARGPA